MTAVPSLLQSIGQSNVPANTAAVIYATTPLWSAILEFLCLGEKMSLKVYSYLHISISFEFSMNGLRWCRS